MIDKSMINEFYITFILKSSVFTFVFSVYIEKHRQNENLTTFFAFIYKLMCNFAHANCLFEKGSVP